MPKWYQPQSFEEWDAGRVVSVMVKVPKQDAASRPATDQWSPEAGGKSNSSDDSRFAWKTGTPSPGSVVMQSNLYGESPATKRERTRSIAFPDGSSLVVAQSDLPFLLFALREEAE